MAALGLLLLGPGCTTHSQCKREQYAIQYAKAYSALTALSALDAGDFAKAHQTEMGGLSICLAQLHELSGSAGLDAHDLRLREELAMKVLDYATANRGHLAADSRSLQMVTNLEALLTKPTDLQRAEELRVFLNSNKQEIQNQ